MHFICRRQAGPRTMMLHLEGVLSPDEAGTLRERLQQADWSDGRATVGEQGARVKRNRQLTEPSPLGRELGQLILQALKRHPLFFSAALPLRIVPPLFNSYEGGEHYGAHVDGAVRGTPTAEGYLRTDLSCTLFLCEPDSYDGGELVVADTYGEHEAKLPAGDLLLYPSNSLHHVLPVTRGQRLCSFFWIQSMVRSGEQRQQLYGLDQTLRSLRARLGDSPEVLSLTQLYHNLLRTWAEL